MHADQDVATVTLGDVAAHERDVLHLVVDALVPHGGEVAVPGGDPRLGDADDVLLVLATPRDEVCDRDQGQVVVVGEHPQLVDLGHVAFVLLADDLADHARRTQIRHPGEVDGRLGVTGTTQDAALLRAQRDDVARG